MGCLNDESFGPSVSGCRDDFDFTNTFEQIWFSIVPACVFLTAFLPRSWFLLREPREVHAPGSLLGLKLISWTVFTAICLSQLVVSVRTDRASTSISSASVSLDFIVALSLTLLSGLEHFKSRRPSVLLCVFLLFTLLFDIARCRTLWLVYQDGEDGHSRTLASLFSSRVAIKTALVVLEALGRRKWLGPSASTHSPEEMTSIFGLALFTWIYRLLGRGYRSPLKTDDLYPLDQSLHVKGRFYDQAPRQKPHNSQQGKNENQPGNASLLFEAVGTGLFQPVLPRVCLIGLKFCQPLFLHTLLNFLQDASGGTDHEQDNQSYGLIGASILIYLGLAVSTSMYWYFQDRALTVLRGFLVTSIYQKTAQAKSDINGDGAPVTLMSTDVERVCTGLRFGHETWASLIEVAIACWLLHGELGNAFLAPLVVVLLSFGASFFISKLSGKYQKVWMQYIQARVGLTSSFLSNLKQLRIGGLSGLVAETVQQKRVEELSKGGNFRTIIAFTAALSQAPGIVSPVVAFAFAFGPLGNPAATTTAFTSLSYIMLLAAPLQWLLQSIPQITASLACLDRIRDYLNAPSWQDSRESAAKEESAVQVLSEPEAVSEKQDDSLIVRSFSAEDRPAIQILDGTFAWKEQENPVLRNINIIVPRSSITLVTGPMASGKSTLCKAILGEVPVASGRVIVNTGRTAYCDQDPFLWNGTIKENIIGCSSFVSSRYEEAVEASALAIDLKNLTDGDQTRVGSKGSSLSGGQKQRVCLARALYQHADLLVFDDVFKGLDSKTQRHIWRCVFGSEGLLRQRGASVVLCTHATEFLRFADHIVRLGSQDSQGTTESQGPPSQILSDVERADSAADPDSFGSASSSLSQQQSSDDDSPPLSEEKEPSARKKEALPSPKSPKSAPAPTTADSAVYKHYASSVGPLPLLLFALLAVIVGFCTVFPTIWIKYWTDDVVRTEPRHGFPFYIGIFSLLAACALACNLPAGIVTMRVMVRLSGSRLHQETLNTITHASLGFLTRTDTGVVLNHFSQDMTIVDTQLPGSLTNLGIVMSVFIGQAVVIATSSAYLAISYPLLLALLYAVQKFYLPTSKRLRLLDLENKSPLYTHFLDTVSGIVTLRAYGWLPQHAKINHDFLNTSQRPYYLLAMVQQWLTLAMNLIVLILAVLLVALATQLRAQPGFAGAGLVSLINFGTLLTGIITAYTTLEVSLGGIARLKHFSEATEQEDSPGEDHVPGREWPSTGSIEIRDVSAGYNYESEKDSLGAEEGLALKHINLSVRAGEKVALCGRTGSGKSSLLALLLRLLDPINTDASSSKILIDKTSIHKIDRSSLRQRIIAVSQDPVFLPDGSQATFRTNLDPFDAASEEDCLYALDAVSLRAAVEAKGGLGAAFDSSALSGGQQKLFMLARAVVRRIVREKAQQTASVSAGGLLLLDEIGAGVDAETEKTFLEILRREFAAYTVLNITHSDEVAGQYDRRIVLDSGCVIEDTAP